MNTAVVAVYVGIGCILVLVAASADREYLRDKPMWAQLLAFAVTALIWPVGVIEAARRVIRDRRFL